MRANLSTPLAAALDQHLRPYAGADPPPPFVLKQLAYLIAVAPLSSPARSAAWSVLGTVPGLRLCGAGTDLKSRPGIGLCADADGDETEILLDTHSGAILAVEERLLQPSILYPFVTPGTIVASDTFTPN